MSVTTAPFTYASPGEVHSLDVSLLAHGVAFRVRKGREQVAIFALPEMEARRLAEYLVYLANVIDVGSRP